MSAAVAATHPGPGEHHALACRSSRSTTSQQEAGSPPHQFQRSLSMDRLKQEVRNYFHMEYEPSSLTVTSPSWRCCRWPAGQEASDQGGGWERSWGGGRELSGGREERWRSRNWRGAAARMRGLAAALHSARRSLWALQAPLSEAPASSWRRRTPPFQGWPLPRDQIAIHPSQPPFWPAWPAVEWSPPLVSSPKSPPHMLCQPLVNQTSQKGHESWAPPPTRARQGCLARSILALWTSQATQVLRWSGYWGSGGSKGCRWGSNAGECCLGISW